MEIAVSDIKQFKQLYLAKFGIELDDKTARYKLLKLVRQMYVIYQPITANQAVNDMPTNEYEENNSEIIKSE